MAAFISPFLSFVLAGGLLIGHAADSAEALELQVGKEKFSAEGYQIRVRRDDQWVTVGSFPILNARQLFAVRIGLKAKYSAAGGAAGELKAVRGVRSDIGAAAVSGTKIWVGFSFYEGEFFDGVGGVGFYDTATGRIGVWRHPALRDCSVSSLTVAEEVIYLATRSMRESGESVCSGLVSISLGTLEAASYIPAGGETIRSYQHPRGPSLDMAEGYDKPAEDLLKGLSSMTREDVPGIEGPQLDALKRLGFEEFMVENAAAEFHGMVSGFDGKTVPLQ